MTRKGLGSEDIMHKQFGILMLQYEGFNLMDCEWFSYDASGEKRSLITGALLKAKGLRPGKSDYEFRQLRDDIMYHIYIEFKVPKGKQSPNQKAFEKTCAKAKNNIYYLAYSVEEAVKILQQEKILIT